MLLKSISLLVILPTLWSCSWQQYQTINFQQEAEKVLPSREESVGFFSVLHKTARDAERIAYDLMYGIRDGADSFVYDAQKDYYENYQK